MSEKTAKPHVKMPRGQWFSVLDVRFYERPSDDRENLEIWCYTDRLSYSPGDSVSFHVSTTAKEYEIEIVRDGYRQEVVAQLRIDRGLRHETPPDASVRGCGWPVACHWRIPADTRSGGYVVIARARGDHGELREQHHFFIVRPVARSHAKLLLIASTCTWTAYNDWGGSNHYEGISGSSGDEHSPVLSTLRPFSRGLIWLPVGAPRIPVDGLLTHSIPRYPHVEFAFANGYCRYYSAAGWASYERHFVGWAERNGYTLDMISQQDLHYRPAIVSGYSGVIVVGHDEYWTAAMRDAIDAYVDDGGHVARFGANFMWQVRLEEEGTRQICYKYDARKSDPEREAASTRLLTSTWEDPLVNRPGAATFGLNALRGIYARIGCAAPRASRGFTVYRPHHWAFAGTDLYYGDVFGSEAGIFGYEVDGVEYTFAGGEPVATHEDGAPATLEILAMAPATSVEEDRKQPGALPYLGDLDGLYKAMILLGSQTPEALRKCQYGSGMVAAFTRGRGSVFNAGTCEWVMGLTRKDFATEQITKNVLDRCLSSAG
jgi:hypothetical protein